VAGDAETMSIQPSFWKPGQKAEPPKPDTKPLTVVYVTSRPKPEFVWFFDSLGKQIKSGEIVHVILVNYLAPVEFKKWRPNPDFDFCPSLKSCFKFPDVLEVRPKPNVWQGKCRVTKEDWWAKCNALNTALCYCETEWIAFVDDRSVLAPTWMDAIRDAMRGNYAVCGSYEKREGMEVIDGAITVSGITVAKDNRIMGGPKRPTVAHAGYWYGCTNALPLDWLLQMNGFPEKCDSVSFEDIITGHLLGNNRRPIYYDTRMHIVEDRTPGNLGAVMKRSSKEKHSYDTTDKTHKILEWARAATTSDNPFNIRELRQSILAGGSFPLPVTDPPPRDWFDGQLLSEM
jgi:hypothetical protein